MDEYCIVDKNEHTVNDNKHTNIIISNSPQISQKITTSTQTDMDFQNRLESSCPSINETNINQTNLNENINFSQNYCPPCPSFCIPVHYEYEEETTPLLSSHRYFYNRQN